MRYHDQTNHSRTLTLHLLFTAYEIPRPDEQFQNSKHYICGLQRKIYHSQTNHSRTPTLHLLFTAYEIPRPDEPFQNSNITFVVYSIWDTTARRTIPEPEHYICCLQHMRYHNQTNHSRTWTLHLLFTAYEIPQPDEPFQNLNITFVVYSIWDTTTRRTIPEPEHYICCLQHMRYHDQTNHSRTWTLHLLFTAYEIPQPDEPFQNLNITFVVYSIWDTTTRRTIPEPEHYICCLQHMRYHDQTNHSRIPNITFVVYSVRYTTARRTIPELQHYICCLQHMRYHDQTNHSRTPNITFVVYSVRYTTARLTIPELQHYICCLQHMRYHDQTNYSRTPNITFVVYSVWDTVARRTIPEHQYYICCLQRMRYRGQTNHSRTPILHLLFTAYEIQRPDELFQNTNITFVVYSVWDTAARRTIPEPEHYICCLQRMRYRGQTNHSRTWTCALTALRRFSVEYQMKSTTGKSSLKQ